MEIFQLYFSLLLIGLSVLYCMKQNYAYWNGLHGSQKS